MTTKTHKTDREHHTPANSLFDLFEMNENIWWPHRSAAKALLETQDNASAYISRCRKMMDEMRDIVRQEQDFALEMSRKACKDFAEKGWSAVPDVSAMSVVFERALSGARAFSEVWMKAQQRSLSAIPSHAYDDLPNNAKRWSDIKMAGPAGDGDSKRRSASHRNEVKASHH